MIAAVLVFMMVLVVALVGWRLKRRTAYQQMLDELQPGMPMAEVADRLHAVGIETTTEANADGGTLLGFMRQVAEDGVVSEQQAVFDERGRLLNLRSVTQIRPRKR